MFGRRSPCSRVRRSAVEHLYAARREKSASAGVARPIGRGIGVAFRRFGGPMISTTESTTSSPANTVVPVTGSPSTAAPSAIATTGLTYAWVETTVVETLRSSHPYAEYAGSEP